MTTNRNGTHSDPDFERELQQAAEETTVRWEDRERELRECLQAREDSLRRSRSAADSAAEQFQREAVDRLDRLQRSSEATASDVQARLEQLRDLAQGLEVERRQYDERSLWGRFKRWWKGLGRRS